MRYVLQFNDRFVVVIVYEVDMVGKPTDSEYQNNYDKHLYNLKDIEKCLNAYKFIYIYIYIKKAFTVMIIL